MAGAVCALEAPEAFQPAERSLRERGYRRPNVNSKWRADRLFLLVPAGALVQQWLKSLAEFPPRQRPEHWSVGDVLEKLQQKGQTLAAASGGEVK